jgi:hypothetical protein
MDKLSCVGNLNQDPSNSKILLRPHYLDLRKAKRYLVAVANVCQHAADSSDPREVIAALDTLRRMPLAMQNLEA